MEPKQIWMSRNTTQKSRYALRTLGGVLGIAVLAMVLIAGGTWLSLSRGWPMKVASTILCLGVAVLVAALAVGLGRRSVGDATVVCLTADDRLFLINARSLVYHGGNLLSQGAAAVEVQQFLRSLARNPGVPAGADEILRVEGLREYGTHYALICRVRHPNGRVIRRSCMLVKGMEREDLLLQQLERRQRCDAAPEAAENRMPLYLFLSGLLCCGLLAVCVLSHPAVGRLPQGLYFPCLGLTFLAACLVVTLVVLQRRGH